MTIQITGQTIITAGAIIGAIGVIIGLIFKFVHWLDRQKEQDTELKELKTHHDEDIQALKAKEAADIAAIKDEQQILTYGMLACLKGLQEKGCNGPVTEAINKLEKHLNQKAHA